MKVSRTAHYAWAAKRGRIEEREAATRAKVKEVFYIHKRRYGSRRVSDEIKDEGGKAGRYLVRRVMREEGLVAKYPKSFRPRTTDSRHTKTASPNLLKEAVNTVFGAGERIVGDITYLPLIGGRFCYLAMFQDVRTKRIVGWSISRRMTAGLVVEALQMALRRGFVKRDCLVHTDRGSQYASDLYRTLLRRCRLRQSMSAKGNCYDNAQAESFFSRFKTETDTRIFASVEDARREAFDYIDCYYNRIRRHSTIGGRIPEFERRLREQTKPGCGKVEKPQSGLSHFPTTPAAIPKLRKGETESFLSSFT